MKAGRTIVDGFLGFGAGGSIRALKVCLISMWGWWIEVLLQGKFLEILEVCLIAM